MVLRDLCSLAEIAAMSERLSIVPYVAANYSYRTIAEKTGISVTTVGRVARAYHSGKGYQLLVKNMPDALKVRSD